jgi:putative DNA primase/helicase
VQVAPAASATDQHSPDGRARRWLSTPFREYPLSEKFDTESINASINLVELVSRYREVKKSGAEFMARCLNPDHADNDPSMTVSQAKGFVHCFSCGYHETAIGILMTAEGIDFVESCKRLLNGSGTSLSHHLPATDAQLVAPVERKKPPERMTCLPPVGTLPPDMAIKKLGEPVAVYAYHAPDGQEIGYVARYEDNGKKSYRCWTWGARSDTETPTWACGHFSTPRPLYGLHKLAQNPDAQVLICEGEKAADAAQQLFPSIMCVTWPGGSNSAKSADWSAVKGRRCVLWPDNDEPGIKAMTQLAAILRGIASEIKGLKVSDLPDGWDAADWGENGDPQTWAKKRVFIYAEADADADAEADTMPADEIPLEAYSGDDAGEEGEDATDTLPTPPNLAPAAINAPPSAMAVTDKGALLMNLDNCVRAIELETDLKSHIWYDEFLDSIITDWQGPRRQWKDADDIKLCLYLQRHVGLTRIGTTQAHDAATVAAFHDTRNQCREWLNGLQWDNTQRVEWLLSDGFGTVHDEYMQAVGRCWMVSMVARVMKPGCKVDTVPVLEGGQGIGKSSALAVLGGDWFVEGHESVMSKDFFGVLNGHMLVEISEMHSFTRAEVERIKGIISCQVDRYRKAYGRNTEDHPRHTVLVCTTNRDDWQRDETGARRFWPVACGEINIDWIRENREQLFAEAVHLYKTGGQWWNVPVDEQRAQVNLRRDVDSWEDVIGKWLTDSARTRVLIGDVLSDCLNIDVGRQDVAMQRRVGRALRALCWTKKVRREPDGTQVKVWMPED